jgi:hypothetical protein
MSCPSIHGVKFDSSSKDAIEQIRRKAELGRFVSNAIAAGVLADIFIKSTPIEASYSIYSTDFNQFANALKGVQSIQKNTIKQIALSQYLRGGSSNQSNFWRAIYDGCLL